MKTLYAGLIALVVVVLLSPAAARADTWGEPINAPDRFTVLSSFSDEAVLDKETGLIWEQSPDTSPRPWGGPDVPFVNSAQFHCETRTVGNRKGWRLPTIQELASLIDPTVPSPGTTLPIGHPFADVQSYFYWSASTNASLPNVAWVVHFGNGSVGILTKSSPVVFVWCVRGGQGVDPQ